MSEFGHNGRIGGGFLATPSMQDVYRLEGRVAELERIVSELRAGVLPTGEQPRGKQQ